MADKLALQIENGLAILTMTDTDKLNTIGTHFSKEFSEAMVQLEGDSGVRALILWGNETVFGAGADVRDPGNVPKTAFEGIAFSRGLHKLFARIENLPYPTVAAIGGIALGGSLELALSCDFRIASESAKLGLPEVNLGTMPGAGGTQRLPRLVGISKAKRMIFTGKKLCAAEALDCGLVDEVVPDGQLLESAKRFAGLFLGKAPLAIAMDKSAIDQGMRMELEQALEYEAKCFAILIETQDIQEGMRAFKEKRKPVYSGK